MYLKEPEKGETKTKVGRRKKITKVRVEINETETKETTEKISETESWLLDKTNKIDH